MPGGVWKLLGPEKAKLGPRFEEPSSARLDLRRFRSSMKIVELKKETRPFPALPAEEGEEEESPDPDQDDQDKPDYAGGPDDDNPPGATAIGESELAGMVPTEQSLLQGGLQGAQSSPSSGAPPMTVETWQIGKPEQFKSDPAEYSDWSLVFKAYMTCISANYIGLFERIEQSRVPMPNRLLSESDKACWPREGHWT